VKREDKKTHTKQRISDIATALFFERGFDAVTIQEIADAAGVSKMTVHNYYPRKEDLVFDRRDEVSRLLEEAIGTRKKGESIVRALRRLIQRLREEDHPFVSANPARTTFWDLVRESASLSARAREIADEAVADLVTILTRAVKAKSPDTSAHLLAGTLLVIWRTAYTESLALQRARAPLSKVHAAFDAAIDRGFAMLEAGMKGTPYA
jgi:AcrR family transcriptional regulator